MLDRNDHKQASYNQASGSDEDRQGHVCKVNPSATGSVIWKVKSVVKSVVGKAVERKAQGIRLSNNHAAEVSGVGDVASAGEGGRAVPTLAVCVPTLS